MQYFTNLSNHNPKPVYLPIMLTFSQLGRQMSSQLLHCEYGGKAHGCGWGLIRWTSATVVFPLRRAKRMGPMGDVRRSRETYFNLSLITPMRPEGGDSVQSSVAAQNWLKQQQNSCASIVGLFFQNFGALRLRWKYAAKP